MGVPREKEKKKKKGERENKTVMYSKILCNRKDNKYKKDY
jgi:hypothetical protein